MWTTRKRPGRRAWRVQALRGQAAGKLGGGGGSQRYPLGQRVDSLLELRVLLDHRLELGDRVEDGGMVLAAERAPDVTQRRVGELARKIHGDLTGEGYRFGPVLGPHVGELDAEELSRLALDVLDGDDPLLLAPQVGEDVLGQLDAHLASGEGAVGDHPREGTLDLPDIGFDATGDQISDVVGEHDPLDLRLLLEDGHPGLEVRGLDVSDQAPLEPRAQALLEIGDLLGGSVGRHHDLFSRVVEIVERVEELLLGPLLARDELDVVDEEEIDRPILRAKLRGAIVADGVDQVVGEALRRQIEQAKLWIEAADLMSHRVEEVRLPQADSTVDEEWIVGARRQLGHRLAGGLGELIRVADDEGVERVADGEAGGGDRRLRLGSGGDGHARFAVDIEGNARIPAEHVARRRLKRLRVVLMEPIPRVRIRRGDLDVITFDGREAARTKPGVEGGGWDPGTQGDQHAAPQRIKHC